MVRSLLKDRVFPWPAYPSKTERKRRMERKVSGRSLMCVRIPVGKLRGLMRVMG